MEISIKHPEVIYRKKKKSLTKTKAKSHNFDILTDFIFKTKQCIYSGLEMEVKSTET